MSAPAFALIIYILWTTLMLLALVGYRTLAVTKGEKAANEFKADGSDVSEFAQRLTRAHANCLESFPIVAGTFIALMLTSNEAMAGQLVMVVVGARIVQSLVHLASTSVLAVQLRFVAFLVQIGLCAYWLVMMVLNAM